MAFAESRGRHVRTLPVLDELSRTNSPFSLFWGFSVEVPCEHPNLISCQTGWNLSLGTVLKREFSRKVADRWSIGVACCMHGHANAQKNHCFQILSCCCKISPPRLAGKMLPTQSTPLSRSRRKPHLPWLDRQHLSSWLGQTQPPWLLKPPYTLVDKPQLGWWIPLRVAEADDSVRLVRENAHIYEYGWTRSQVHCWSVEVSQHVSRLMLKRFRNQLNKEGLFFEMTRRCLRCPDIVNVGNIPQVHSQKVTFLQTIWRWVHKSSLHSWLKG